MAKANIHTRGEGRKISLETGVKSLRDGTKMQAIFFTGGRSRTANSGLSLNVLYDLKDALSQASIDEMIEAVKAVKM